MHVVDAVDGDALQPLVSSKWALVRAALRNGRLLALPYRKRYSTVSAAFLKLFPDTFDRAIPVMRHKEVDELLHKLDLAMWRYEQAQTYCRENPGKRMKGRSGCCGLVGPKRDLLVFHRQEMLDLQEQIREARRKMERAGQTPSWFVFFKTQYAAAVASQTLIHGEDNREFKVRAAPGPEEVNWSALWMSYRQRDLRGWVVQPLLAVLVLIPIGIFAGSLMQLESAFCPIRRCLDPVTGDSTQTTTSCPAGTQDISGLVYWAWYCNGQQNNRLVSIISRFISGWLPALLVTLWQGMVIPLLSYMLIQASGRCYSLSEVDRTIASWLWYFSAFNSFLGGLIGSTLTSQFRTLVDKGPWDIVLNLGAALPYSSNFFLNYVMFRALVSIPMRMVQPHPGIRFYIFRRWLRYPWLELTERDKAFLYTPTSPRYGYEVGVTCGIFLIGFAYAVVSPIIMVVCSVFFMLSWVFWRYTLLYVYIRKYESGGLMWPFLFERILIMLVVMAVLTSCVFIVKAAYIQAILLLVCVPVWVYRYNSFCYFRYQVGIESIPLATAIDAPPAKLDPRVYIPPPLNKKAVGWHPEWTKPWSGWGLPA